MNTRWIARTVVSALMLIAGLALVSVGCADEEAMEAEATATGPEALERERISSFWRNHREAAASRRAGDIEAAVSSYTKALRYDPKHEDSLYQLGNLLMESGDFHEARHSFERLISVNRNSVNGYSRLGDLELCMEPEKSPDPIAAELAYSRAHAINKEETGPSMGLAWTALVRGDHGSALSRSNEVLVTHNNSIEAHFMQGCLAVARRDWQEQREQANHILELSEKSKQTPAMSSEGDTATGSRPMTRSWTRCNSIGELVQRAPTEIAAHGDQGLRTLCDSLFTQVKAAKDHQD